MFAPLLRFAILGLLCVEVRCVVRAIAGGTSHSCAILDSREVKCWGSSGSGQLGYEDTQDRGWLFGQMGTVLPAVSLAAGHVDAKAVSAGAQHTCVLLESGEVKCWGSNTAGQLGRGDTADIGDGEGEMGSSLSAVSLGTGRTVIAITSGWTHNCALLDNRSVKCWGRNAFGTLGLGDVNHRGDSNGEMGDDLPAVDLGDNFTVTAISAGRFHTCALSEEGLVKCWGLNGSGQLGQGHGFSMGNAPGQMGGNLKLTNLGLGQIPVAISAGGAHSCALLNGGGVKCWGGNTNGQLGYEDTNSRGLTDEEMGDALPLVDLGTNRTAVMVEASAQFSCALLDDGTVKCWGKNDVGQLGQGTTTSIGRNGDQMGDKLDAVDIGESRSAVSIAAGQFHVMAILDDGTLKCWGQNSFGQLGIENTEDMGDGPGEMGENLPAVLLGEDRYVFTSIVCPLGSFGQGPCEECRAGTWSLAIENYFARTSCVIHHFRAELK